MEPELRKAARPEGLPVTAFLERTLLEMSRNPLVELADDLASDGDLRRREEGDSGPFLERLAEFLQGKDAAIIGGVAVRSYVRERPTLDLDVMIGDGLWRDMVRFLDGQGAQSTGCIENTYMYTFADFKLDLDIRLARTGLDREALQATLPRRFKKWILQLVQPDYLAAMKVKAFAERSDTAKGDQDRRDVQRLVAGPTTEPAVRAILERHRPDLLATLDTVFHAPRRP